MNEIKWNDKNEIWVIVDHNKKQVYFFTADWQELKPHIGWTWQKGMRKYPAITIPATGKDMSCHKIVANTYNIKQRNKYITFYYQEHNKLPKLVIDHIDNNPFNYMPENLRFCTQSDNLLYYYNVQINY